MCSILSTIQKILSKQFCINETEIQPETKLELELGADSRDLLELMAIFEITFDIEIAYEDVNDIITVQNIIDYIENEQKARDELFKNLF